MYSLVVLYGFGLNGAANAGQDGVMVLYQFPDHSLGLSATITVLDRRNRVALAQCSSGHTMLLAPLRARAAHVVEFRAIRIR
jgi:hypothetical protein